MDLRELIDDPEEAIRAIFAGLMKQVRTAQPSRVTEDTKNGHVATVQPTVKREVTDQSGKVTYEDHPVHVDVPIHHLGGGGVSLTHPNKKDDEGLVVYADRAVDSWFQSGGSQQPMDYRMHSLADGFFISGARSTPRMLQQVSQDTSQLRSDDKKHVLDHDPASGTHIKSVDPSTASASASFDPFTQATAFYEHLVKGASGLFHNATSGGTTHAYSLTHAIGHIMAAANGQHSVTAHPSDGAALNAANLLHKVLAHPSLGALLSAAGGQHLVHADPQSGVQISSSSTVQISSPGSIGFDAPSLSFPSGGISSGALATDANGNQLGGDLSGTLAQALVLGLTHVANAQRLPNYANDIAAAAGVPPVAIGSLYRNGSQLMVRVA